MCFIRRNFASENYKSSLSKLIAILFMNRLVFLYILLALVTGSLTACQEEDQGFTFEEVRTSFYVKKFVSEFGEPDPGHKWGFEDIESPISEINTRVAIPNSNQWSGDPYYLDVPAPLTGDQIATVTTWFETHRNPTGVAVNWTDYFAQQVSSTDYGRHMDELYDNGSNGNNHVYNFNSGDGAAINVDNRYTDKIMYMQGQSTISFSYHESVSSKTWYDHYVIIPGEVIDPTNAHGLHGMYFLGFDYEANKDDSDTDDVARDYFFNDWIIKITPGLRTNPAPVRIMAEDLGAIGDFDFNDVVFDVYINYNQYWHGADYGMIILRAAGGTMPLYVNDMDHEVHGLFGVDVSTIVNTPDGTAYSVSRPIVQWSFTPKSANPLDIPITVQNTMIDSRYEVGAVLGVAPGKFAVPTTVQWSPENINIKTTYPKFNAWVKDQNIHFWE